jgi:DNA-binding transcriptional ArsR family regulator
MLSEYTYDELISAMAVIAEPTRLRIMGIIASRGSMCAKDILPEFNITQPTLSHHMSLLIENGLVLVRKEGRKAIYQVNHKMIDGLSDLMSSLNEPPVTGSSEEGVKAGKAKTMARQKAVQKKPALKKTSSVPVPKITVESPDISKLQKEKKKKKEKDKKKKDKKKKK